MEFEVYVKGQALSAEPQWELILALEVEGLKLQMESDGHDGLGADKWALEVVRGAGNVSGNKWDILLTKGTEN